MESAHHPPYAALSIGMINNKLYNKYKIENNIDFRLRYDPGYNVIVDNQINFLEGYRSNGIKIMHFADKYSAYYPHRDIDFGDKNGPIIFQPIISKYFKAMKENKFLILLAYYERPKIVLNALHSVK
jgi:hypothetical protein